MSVLSADQSIRNAPDRKSALVAAVLKRYKDASEAKMSWENQAYINIAFLLGYQWLNWDDGTGFIEIAADPEQRYHLVHNLIQPAVRTQVSRIIAHKPWVTCLPTTAEQDDVDAARLGTKLLEFWRRKLMTSTLEVDFCTWLATCGTAIWRVGWDAHAGRSIIQRPLAPYNEGILSPDRQETFSARPARPDSRSSFERYLDEQLGTGPTAPGYGGVAASEEAVEELPEGDVLLECVNPFEIYPEPMIDNWDRASWVIHARRRTRDDVRAAWGDKIADMATTVADAGSVDAPGFNPDRIPKGGSPYNVNSLFAGVTSTNDSDIAITEYWERASKGFPSGRHVLVVGGVLVHDGHNPFPFNDIPLVPVLYEKVPGTPWGRGLVESVRPAQQEFNMTVSQLAEARDYTSFPKILVPRGTQLAPNLGQNIPGEVWEYSGGIPPTVLQAPQMPAYMGTLMQQSYQMIMDLTHQHEVTRGTVPPNVEYGIAIQLLHEADNSPLRSTYDMIDDGLVRVSRMLLGLAQKYYTEVRMIRVVGVTKEPQVLAFTGADLRGIIDVYVEPRSAQANTLGAKRKEIMDLYQMGLFGMPGDPVVRQRVLQALEMGHLNELFEENLTVEEAVLEHLRLMASQQGGVQALVQWLQSIGAPVVMQGGQGQPMMAGQQIGPMMALPQAG
jgi:hypothetical protein